MTFFFFSARVIKYLLANSCLFATVSSLSSIAPPRIHIDISSSPSLTPTENDDNNHPNNHHPLLELEKFHQWADAQGIERKVQIRYDTTGELGGGRELIATERLEPGDVAVRVPLEATIRLESSTPALENDDNWAGILASKLHQEDLMGDDSKFVHYIANLPTEAPHTPCRWDTTTQQLELLQNETFVDVIKENSEWRKRQLINQNVDSNHGTDFLKWLDLVCSRTLKGSRGDGSRQLVPLVDIANHAPIEAGGGYFVVDDTSVSLMVGSRGVNAGQPVTLDYGARNIEDFVLHYGFVPQRCISDSVTVQIPSEDEEDEESVTIGWDDIRGYNGHERQDVRDACERMLLQNYPTTLEEDVAKLNSNTFVDEAEQMAVSYRYAKKSLLKSAVGISQQGQQQSAFSSSSFAFL